MPGRGQTPAFAVDAFYARAREDGGSLLLIAGDASGKGLNTAMLVASVIGAFRGQSSRQPAVVLEHLNRVLLGKTKSGYLTCCRAMFQPDGGVTMANAEHLAPYLAGREVETEAGLPLGIAAGVEYAETRAMLGESVMTFVSDGVVEAANSRNDLCEFDRTHEIAEAAKA